MGYNKNNSKGMPKHGMSQDHKMAYDRSEISRLKKDIHYDDLKKKSMGPAAYGKMEQGPLNGNAFGHAMQKAGGNYDKAKAMLENKGPAKHGEMHDSPMSMGGSFMSKHASNSYFHKKNLLDDMPIDDHAGGPLKQTEVSVYDDRKNKQGQTQSEILNSASDKVNKAIEQHNQTQFTSQERVDASKRMIDDLKKNYTTKIDSINNANSKMNKLINEMNKGNYPGSLQN
jgi:hypothetical protein